MHEGEPALSQTAAASLGPCDFHLRAGVNVPAVHVVDGEALCSACFDGKPISEGGTKAVPASQITGAPHSARNHGVLSAQAARCIQRRHERIHSVHAAPHDKQNPQGGSTALSPREIEVVTLLAERRGTKDIATAMKISVRTVKAYVSGALAKSGTQDRTALVLWWVQGFAPGRAPASLRECVARIERDLGTISSAVRDRATRIERELEATASTIDCVTQIERSFEALKASLVSRGEE